MASRRAALVAVITMLLAFAASLAGVRPAVADDNDRIDKMTVNYQVDTSGILHVTETIVYRFGENSARHGIERTFITREAYDDKHDATYDIADMQVTSPDAPSTYTTYTSSTNAGRTRTMTYRIGSATQTVDTPTATYTLKYNVTGEMRTFSGYDELYWDAVSTSKVEARNVSITVTVPGGVQQTTCNNGPVKTSHPCQASIADGVATYTIPDKAAGDIVTIGAKIKSGVVSDNAPHLVTRGDQDQIDERNYALVGAGATTVLAPIAGVVYYRRRGRDQRFLGVPPGVIPGPGEQANVGPSPKIEIPVAFSPPRITPAEGGYLEDGVLNTKETAATLIDLAVRGALQVRNTPDSETCVRLLDASKATAPHEQVLLQNLFAGVAPGQEIELSGRGDLTQAHDAMVSQLLSEVQAKQWFTSLPGLRAAGGGCLGVLAFFGAWWLFTSHVTSSLLWLVAPLVPIVVTVLVVRQLMRRGQRTALGRAYTDQVEGFRTYLATAEAEQLRFEEGEDIYSKYLPWAIVFGLAERWAKVCERLVQLGRLSAEPPLWYYGPYNGWNFWIINDSIGTIDSAAMPPVNTGGSSGSGFGGGSSFDGGGFSGGGGGGGDIGSW